MGVQENTAGHDLQRLRKIQEAQKMQEISIPSYSTLTPTTKDGVAGSHTWSDL